MAYNKSRGRRRRRSNKIKAQQHQNIINIEDTMPQPGSAEDAQIKLLVDLVMPKLQETQMYEQAISSVADRETWWIHDRTPEYFIAPDGITHLRVAHVEGPPDIYTELGAPAPTVPDLIEVQGLTCPVCDNTDGMKGYNLDAPPDQPDRIVQCSNCGQFHFMQRGKVQDDGN